jgi:AbiV family abortive infection protein
MTRGGPVSRDIVLRLGRECSENALALVEEANLLHENGHSARAFALTVLAAEELGKAFVCVGVLAQAGEDPGDWEAFWKVIGGKSHEIKVLTALFLEQHLLEAAGLPLDSLARELSGLVPGELNDAKFKSLYVDLKDGEIATPSEIGDDEDAMRRSRSLRKSIVTWAVAMQVGSFETPQ